MKAKTEVTDMQVTENEKLLQRARAVIPNGMYGHQSTGLLPPVTPQFFARAQGTYLWDYDGNRFIDLMSGYGPNLFGYGHEAIDAAYRAQLQQIDAATGPSAAMVDLAERFVAQIDHADWAMFCKNGTDATTMALMTARAYRGKRKVLFASGTYHGAAPWCTPLPTGTVPEDRAHFVYHRYNDLDSLAAAAAECGDDLAGVFVTPHRHEVIADQELPHPAYARALRTLCDERDALLIIDDVRAGFRIARDSSWSPLGIAPDLSTWGKAIANGHALSALAGSDRVREAAASIYVTGSFWFAAAAMAASLETLALIRGSDYLERTVAMGDQLRAGLTEICSRHELAISQTGPSQMPLVIFDDARGQRDPALTYAFAEQMVRGGVHFHPFHNMFVNAAMTEADIEHILSAAERAAGTIRRHGVSALDPHIEAFFTLVGGMSDAA
ncbi:MAG: aminotransferase class III-fold pyridoxal phosphate-dependent enzyme [Pseudomonadota bacterium]